MEATYLRTLECGCGNNGIAVYSGMGAVRKLHDLAGDFKRRGDGDDPEIFCDFCDKPVKT